MERLAYLLKQRFPALFCGVEALARSVTIVRFGRHRDRALANARIEGTVGGRPAEIRPLGVGDVTRLTDFLAAMPEEHLRFFHPHGFDAGEVERVVRSRAFMTYGLFVSGEFVAYALLKLSPTGRRSLGGWSPRAMPGKAWVVSCPATCIGRLPLPVCVPVRRSAGKTLPHCVPTRR